MVCNCINFPHRSHDWFVSCFLVSWCVRSQTISFGDISVSLVGIKFHVRFKITSISNPFDDGTFVRRYSLRHRLIPGAVVPDGSFAKKIEISNGCNAHTRFDSWSPDIPNFRTRSPSRIRSEMANTAVIFYGIHSDRVSDLFEHTGKSDLSVENGKRGYCVRNTKIPLWVTRWKSSVPRFLGVETRQEEREWQWRQVLCTLVNVEVQRSSQTIFPSHTFTYRTTNVRNQCSFLLFNQNIWRCWFGWIPIANRVNNHRIFERINVTGVRSRFEPIPNQIVDDGEHVVVGSIFDLTYSQYLTSGKHSLFDFTSKIITNHSFQAKYVFLAPGSMFLVMAFVVSYGLGMGPIPYMIGSSLLSSKNRSVGMSIGCFFNWFCNFIVGITFPILQSYLNQYVFLVFAFFTFLTFIIVLLNFKHEKCETSCSNSTNSTNNS